ncbi:MAG TPA: pyruvate dehydrogenase (acetyl-transferring) E1 component subunit alpha [Dermatophilaceae bacterium]|nr:pyruvate dehydrogenase (acetyl-transferring) E1 component subunit alpha [Dermatophilaceae bacterium]
MTTSKRADGSGGSRSEADETAAAAAAAAATTSAELTQPADEEPFQQALIPAPSPVRFIDNAGNRVTPVTDDYTEPPTEQLLEAYRRMVIGRRFNVQATALTMQGRLAVYPSSRGQEACQVGAVLALRDTDWFFPTYRDSVAIITRGVDTVECLTSPRGNLHVGYDPVRWHTASPATPLATQLLHAAGLAYGERRRGRDTVALAFIGDGATSEGDFHEALNFAAVFKSPVVFVIQNNGWAISVPLSKQTAAPSLAYKGIGYGVVAEQADGNDVMAVLAVINKGVEYARAGRGPVLVELHTYRMEAHTNADDASRYRDAGLVEEWSQNDPIVRLESYLLTQGLIDQAGVDAVKAEAEAMAAELRERMNAEPQIDPMSMFTNVYAVPTPQLEEQREMVRAEIEADSEALAAGEASGVGAGGH